MAETRTGGDPAGSATDQHNNPVHDPTANVRELVDAAIQRQDDLRSADSAHLRELVGISAEIAKIRVQHAAELREAEAKRIDAIRAVDVDAVRAAAQVQATQASTLAKQVADSAEALRNQVSAATTAATVALAAALEPIQRDIADLRKSQYEAVGQKTQVVETRDRGNSNGMWIGVAIVGMGLFVSAAAVVVSILINISGP